MDTPGTSDVTSNKEPCLEYHSLMLKEVVHSNCFVVSSPGLGLERVLIHVLNVWSGPGRLVFIVGGDLELENYLRTRMQDDKVTDSCLPRAITSEVSINERKKLYAKGGCFSVTSRILVVDMLLDRIPWESISGIIVWNGHSILEAHQDAFILKLFRLNNQNGFIKAFSQTPHSLSKGLMTLDRIMRLLFAKEIFIWPRSRPEVVESLDSRAKPNVIEIRVNLTPLMESIQFAVMDLLDMLLKDLKNSNPSLFSDADEINIENVITPNFSRLVRRSFEPVWHQLSILSKRILEDMKLLRRVLFSLTDDDCVTFNDLITSIRQGITMDVKTSDWIFYDPAETLFVTSKERLGIKKNANTGQDIDLDDPDLEQNPKWSAFYQVVQEIKEETKNLDRLANILVIVRDDSLVDKLQIVVDKGPERTLKQLYLMTRRQNNVDAVSVDDDGLLDKSHISFSEAMKDFQEVVEVEDDTQAVSTKGLNILYHSIYGSTYLELDMMLFRHKPWFIILYDPDVETVRRLEVYQAIHCSPDQCKIYLIMYDSSAEEQRYLTALRKEKDAFEKLMFSSKRLVIPKDNPELERTPGVESKNKRARGLCRKDILKQKVVVDMREFRCQLPALLHKRGIDIEPVTIEIGDYVLTPEVCVERKSLMDLIGSLDSGRLYNQARVMTRYYKKSILLIEFDDRQEFGLRGRLSFQGSNSVDTTKKLILLTISCPKLLVLWSPSPPFSAELFEMLKVDREQPDTNKILDISSEELPVDYVDDRFDLEAKDLLLSLPGVNLHNVYAIMRKYFTLMDVLAASREELKEVLGSERNANDLYDSLHKNLSSYCVNLELEVGQKQQTKRTVKRKKK